MKYDKCLNINVVGFSEQKKKLVQDAFFKLGFSWNNNTSKDYKFLEDGYKSYVNNSLGEKKPTSLMYSNDIKQNKYTVTFNQLMEIANMTEHKDNTFSKSDLKTGMILELTSGEIVMVLLGTNNGDIVSGDTWFPLKDYGDDHLFNPKQNNTLSVKGVYQPIHNSSHNLAKFNTENTYDYQLIWKRNTKTPQQKELRLLEAKQRELAKQQQDLADQMKNLRGSV